MVVPHGEAAGGVFCKAAEMLTHALADRFERLEASGTSGGMDTDALGRTMIDGDKHCGLPLAGDRGGEISAPAGVEGIRDDGSVVAARPAWCADAGGGEKV